MKNFFLYLLILIFVGEVVYLARTKLQTGNKKVLALEAVSTTPLPTPTLSPTPSPTITPSAKPTFKPTPTPVPQPKFTSEQIYEFTNRFASQYGVDPNVIRAIAVCESGFNPSAKYIRYVGLFQFDVPTWKSLRIKMGEDANPDLRENAEEAVQTAAYAISIGKRYIWPKCNP